MSPDIVGSVAAMLTTISFVPQAIKAVRTRDMAAISLPMYVLFTSGVALWAIYGAMLGRWPIVAANLITLILALVILTQKIRYVRAVRR